MKRRSFLRIITCAISLSAVCSLWSVANAQGTGSELYKKLAATQLTMSAQVASRTVKVDRVTLTLNGTLYFGDPVEGKNTLAVFIGNGTFDAPVP